MQSAKNTVKLGMLTSIGSGVVGGLGASVPASAPAVGAVNTALNLAAVGNLANVGMNILPPIQEKNKKDYKDINPFR